MYDLALTLVQRKWWALGTFVLVVLAALIWMIMQPDPDYRAEAKVEMVPIPLSLQQRALVEQRGDAAVIRAVKAVDVAPARLRVSYADNRLEISVRGHERESVAQGAEKAVEAANDAQALANITMAELAVRDRLDAESQRLEQRRSELAALLSAYRSGRLEQARIVDEPSTTSDSRTGLVLALATVLGLMLGLFAAFFAEFIAGVRERMRNP